MRRAIEGAYRLPTAYIEKMGTEREEKKEQKKTEDGIARRPTQSGLVDKGKVGDTFEEEEQRGQAPLYSAWGQAPLYSAWGHSPLSHQARARAYPPGWGYRSRELHH